MQRAMELRAYGLQLRFGLVTDGKFGKVCQWCAVGVQCPGFDVDVCVNLGWGIYMCCGLSWIDEG